MEALMSLTGHQSLVGQNEAKEPAFSISSLYIIQGLRSLPLVLSLMIKGDCVFDHFTLGWYSCRKYQTVHTPDVKGSGKPFFKKIYFFMKKFHKWA